MQKTESKPSDKIIFHYKQCFKFREEKTRLESALSKIEKELRTTEETLSSAMLDENISSFKIDGKTIITSKKRYYSFSKESFQEVFNWLCSMRGGYLIERPHINIKALTDFIKKLEKKDLNLKLPPGLNLFTRSTITIRNT